MRKRCKSGLRATLESMILRSSNIKILNLVAIILLRRGIVGIETEVLVVKSDKISDSSDGCQRLSDDDISPKDSNIRKVLVPKSNDTGAIIITLLYSGRAAGCSPAYATKVYSDACTS